MASGTRPDDVGGGKTGSGIWGSIACRKRYIDEKVREALDHGVDAVVILGAGLDTRGPRLAVPAGVPVFEVDLPANIYGSGNLYRRFRGENPLWNFGMTPGEVAGLLTEYGWREIEQAGRTEFLDRYIRPTGRSVEVSGIERACYATKA
jgi:O-methyltransferase involved in polyketide biosynthesis